MQVAAWHSGGTIPPTKVHKIRKISVNCMARPLTMPNVITLRQKVSEIAAVENLCSPKVDQSPPKPLRIRYPPILLTLANMVALRQKCRIYPLFKIFVPLEKSKPKFSKFGEQVSIHQTPNHAKFHRARSKDVYEKSVTIFLHR